MAADPARVAENGGGGLAAAPRQRRLHRDLILIPAALVLAGTLALDWDASGRIAEESRSPAALPDGRIAAQRWHGRPGLRGYRIPEARIAIASTALAYGAWALWACARGSSTRASRIAVPLLSLPALAVGFRLLFRLPSPHFGPHLAILVLTFAACLPFAGRRAQRSSRTQRSSPSADASKSSPG
jgi:hypothetical protein